MHTFTCADCGRLGQMTDADYQLHKGDNQVQHICQECANLDNTDTELPDTLTPDQEIETLAQIQHLLTRAQDGVSTLPDTAESERLQEILAKVIGESQDVMQYRIGELVLEKELDALKPKELDNEAYR